jgi:hypothetical protein
MDKMPMALSTNPKGNSSGWRDKVRPHPGLLPQEKGIIGRLLEMSQDGFGSGVQCANFSGKSLL